MLEQVMDIGLAIGNTTLVHGKLALNTTHHNNKNKQY